MGLGVTSKNPGTLVRTWAPREALKDGKEQIVFKWTVLGTKTMQSDHSWLT